MKTTELQKELERFRMAWDIGLQHDVEPISREAVIQGNELLSARVSRFSWMIPLAIVVGVMRLGMPSREVSWFEAYVDFSHILVGMLFLATGLCWQWNWKSFFTNVPFWTCVWITAIETIMFLHFKGLL